VQNYKSQCRSDKRVQVESGQTVHAGRSVTKESAANQGAFTFGAAFPFGAAFGTDFLPPPNMTGSVARTAARVATAEVGATNASVLLPQQKGWVRGRVSGRDKIRRNATPAQRKQRCRTTLHPHHYKL